MSLDEPTLSLSLSLCVAGGHSGTKQADKCLHDVRVSFSLPPHIEMQASGMGQDAEIASRSPNVTLSVSEQGMSASKSIFLSLTRKD